MLGMKSHVPEDPGEEFMKWAEQLPGAFEGIRLILLSLVSH